jgi:hypothetical protein
MSFGTRRAEAGESVTLPLQMAESFIGVNVFSSSIFLITTLKMAGVFSPKLWFPSALLHGINQEMAV